MADDLTECYDTSGGKPNKCFTSGFCIAILYHDTRNDQHFCASKKNILCNHWSKGSDGPFYVLCCDEPFCNKVSLNSLFPNHTDNSTLTKTSDQPKRGCFIGFVVGLALVLLLLGIFMMIKFPLFLRQCAKFIGRLAGKTDTFLESEKKECTLLSSGRRSDWSSRAESSDCHRIKTKTFKDHVELQWLIGEGRYGKVYSGLINGQQIAVKIIECNLETQNELEFINRFLLCHRNIVKYITHDTCIDDKVTYWLAMPLYEKGNLYFYLRDNTLSLVKGLSILHDVVAGLHYLHEIFDPVLKPRIAHRDLKSANILIDRHLRCCLGDLGLALCDSELSSVSVSALLLKKGALQVGTKRYMSPELLAMSLDASFFPSYLMMDIYSLSLVIWEVFSRVILDSDCLPFFLPYEEVSGMDPSIDNMNHIVNELEYRPKLRDTPSQHSDLLLDFNRLIKKCWQKSPENRPKSEEVLLYALYLIEKYSLRVELEDI